MRHRFTPQFERAYADAPEPIRRAFDRKLALLVAHGHRYHSLRTHPWPADGPDAMQARVTKRVRFYYVLDGDTYVIYRLREEHPKSSTRGR